MLSKFLSISQNLKIPAPCVLCNQYHRAKLSLCQPCLKLLVPLPSGCIRCRLPLLSLKPETECGHCSKHEPAFDRVYSAYSFEEPLRTLLHEFKYKKAFYLKTLMVRLLLEALPQEAWQTECLIPIPMHPKRLKQRGFNQSLELTKVLAKALTLPYATKFCEKILNTAPQMSLNREARLKNLSQSFRAKPTPYQHITLIDDLLTTGSTASALSLEFKKQGVTRVDVWCIARTPEPGH